MPGTIEIQGLEEVERCISGLPEKVNRRLVMQALTKSSRPLIASAKSKVMGYSQTVGKSIKVTFKDARIQMLKVGVKKSVLKGGVRNPWYAHFIEFGVSGVGRFKGGKRRYRADQPARPFMRPAFDETKGQIADEFGKVVAEVVNKYWEKQGAKRVT